jgi:beta-N-acetylhexosaminidase
VTKSVNSSSSGQQWDDEETQKSSNQPFSVHNSNQNSKQALKSLARTGPFPRKRAGAKASKRITDNDPRILPPSSEGSPLPIKGQVLFLVVLLAIVLINSIRGGAMQFVGPQGWASILGGPAGKNNSDLFKNPGQLNGTPLPGAKVSPAAQITPQQYIDIVIRNMPLDMKIGQMMLVQFIGPDYSPDISSMISQYNIGGVLIFASNNNIMSKEQLKLLIQQMQSNSSIPLVVAIDQEGGYVNRLESLHGFRPSATTIGATHNPEKAKMAGMQDAQDLSNYGINMNLAPVVDVDTNSASELHRDQRTFGTDPTLVAQMASAYLQGLQQSGKVIGTLKHFPGLGAVTVDPHVGVPHLTRSRSDLERIDWAPYRTLISQGNVHAIMVTHEVLTAIDKTQPATLSPKVVTEILRNQMGYQGVIMTDSLTMRGIVDYVSEDQVPGLAVAAGSDLLMGAASPNDVAAMIASIKQALNHGLISEQRIDDSLRRILKMKYQMGLLSLPLN